jgi:hypothetical protein
MNSELWPSGALSNKAFRKFSSGICFDMGGILPVELLRQTLAAATPAAVFADRMTAAAPTWLPAHVLHMRPETEPAGRPPRNIARPVPLVTGTGCFPAIPGNRRLGDDKRGRRSMGGKGGRHDL